MNGFTIMSLHNFQENLQFRVTTVFAPSTVGIYAIYPDEGTYFNSYWDTCREQFAKKFRRDALGFFISVEADAKDSIPKFISKCEQLLELRKFSKFYLTDMKQVIFIEPCAFWRNCYMKRSLFSLLCRLGIYYHLGAKFEDYLFGNLDNTKQEKIDNAYEFARRTKLAIARFFAGYTKYRGAGPNLHEYFPEKHGWTAEFSDKDVQYIKNVLVNPKYHFHGAYFFEKNIFLS